MSDSNATISINSSDLAAAMPDPQARPIRRSTQWWTWVRHKELPK